MGSNETSPSTESGASTPGGRPERAIQEFERAVRERPSDVAAAEKLAARLVDSAEAAAAAGRCAEALAYFTVAANWRESRGHMTTASALRARIEQIERSYLESQLALTHTPENGGRVPNEPGPAAAGFSTAPPRDLRTRAQHARECVARGDAIGAAKHLSEDMAEGDPVLLLAIAEIMLRAGKHDRGIVLIERALAANPAIGRETVRIGIELARRQPDAGFLLVEMAADTWAAQSQWPLALAALREFIEEQPGYVPALVRLREMEAGPPNEARSSLRRAARERAEPARRGHP